jgi:hypothetical protein
MRNLIWIWLNEIVDKGKPGPFVVRRIYAIMGILQREEEVASIGTQTGPYLYVPIVIKGATS